MRRLGSGVWGVIRLAWISVFLRYKSKSVSARISRLPPRLFSLGSTYVSQVVLEAQSGTCYLIRLAYRSTRELDANGSIDHSGNSMR